MHLTNYSNISFFCWKTKILSFIFWRERKRKFVQINLLVEILFVCKYVFLKQKMYVLIPIWLMRAGKKFSPSRFPETRLLFLALFSTYGLMTALRMFYQHGIWQSRISLNKIWCVFLTLPSINDWAFFVKIVFKAWYFFSFVLCEVTKGLFLSSIVIKGNWSQIAFHVEHLMNFEILRKELFLLSFRIVL